ncbi:MAG: G5 domain-containing protein [Christensenella sp.]|uniref:G5 domain-containing protein n=1 Tax=Christensenella sp. TaxID=1935934 RepID=UPI002B209B22|nr:G5 domain-containing protein [Christensenella sp.]MEA5002617.1 G5 domain-containing protein [Christensenella sp.]
MPVYKKKKDDEINPNRKYKGILYTTHKPNFSDEDLTPIGSRSRRARNKKQPGKLAEAFSALSTTKTSRRSSKKAPAPSPVQTSGSGRVVFAGGRSGRTTGGRSGGIRDHFFRNIAIVCAAVVAVSCIAIPTSFAKPTTDITLNDNGRVLQASTGARTVQEFLDDNGVSIGTDDVVSTDLSAPVYEGQSITIYRAMPLTVKSNGQEIEVSIVAGHTVQDALDKAGVIPAADDEVYPSPDSLVRSGMVIDHIIVTTQETTEQQSIPFENTTRENAELEKGKTQVAQEGAEGVLQITYKELYKNGALISRESISEDVIQQPVNQIMEVGTYVKPEPKPEPKKSTSSSSSSNKKPSKPSSSGSSGSSNSGGETDLNGRKAIKVQVTAYCSNCDGGSKTASGTYPHWGTLASNSLPFGTRVYIEGYGEGVVEDRGGMASNVIDIYMGDQPDETACNAWGRKTMTVYILN